ncbi:hypothetical protein K458DRAFT_415113 [Lentithecium fluviatile CBS 122367]|uniref:F-box domain-containing protein n=1 Tax=Lentithecium fluviatile CBS 122367 TaxID=1168545 RepID=A0A6G1JD38_9PLEO|nr:hypothetical protein K458DRAFT_415113 [Lentithecium fluviatile CBS 122367]
MGSYLSTTLPQSRQEATSSWMTQLQQKIHDEPNKPHPNEHITAQNNTHSHFHRLPTELLLEIDSYLGAQPSASCYSAAVPRMALRATCRRFRAELSGPPPPRYCWSSWDRRAYTGLLKLAKFRALCQMEKEGKLDAEEVEGGGQRRVCCICRSSHEKDCFTPVEQKKEPENRMCIGSQGVLEICPHNRVTYAGLRIKPINMTCNGAHYPINGTGQFHGAGTTVKVREVETQGRKEAKIETMLSLGAVERKPQMESVIRALKKADWSVCPHLQTSNEEAWHTMLLEDAETLATVSTTLSKSLLGLIKRWVSRNPEELQWQVQTCAAPHCDTRMNFSTVRNHRSKSQGFLFLKIERYLGELTGGADGKKWLSQIVEASKLEEDKIVPVLVHGTHEMAHACRMNKKATQKAQSGWWEGMSRKVRSWFVSDSM